MSQSTKSSLRNARKRRIRAKIIGTRQRPRLCVFCSLTALSVQVIDDTAGKTLVSASIKGKNIDAAKKLGMDIASKAKNANISTIVFDRNARKYHGRIKALADAARAGGLIF